MDSPLLKESWQWRSGVILLKPRYTGFSGITPDQQQGGLQIPACLELFSKTSFLEFFFSIASILVAFMGMLVFVKYLNFSKLQVSTIIFRQSNSYLNMDTLFLFCPCRSCKVEEEPEDSDDDEPSYRKTYKQQSVNILKKLCCIFPTRCFFFFLINLFLS